MPYPWSSTNVLTATDLNAAFAGYTVNAQTGTTYTFVLTDRGKLVTATNASAQTYTIPLNASVAYATGTVINVLNLGAGTVTLSPTGGVTLNGATTLAQYASVALTKVGTDSWVAVAGGLPKASVSSTTGTPTTGANGSKTYYKWTASGSVTIGTGGTLEILVVGGGGAGCGVQGGGGGAGGVLSSTTAYLPAGTHTITVGAGGAAMGTQAGGAGSSSLVGPYIAPGGGGTFDRVNMANANFGGSGGGGSYGTFTGGNGITGVGNNGGNGSATSAGGGGGAGAVGGAGSGTTGAAGGAGVSNSITGVAVTYGGGGGGSGSVTGGAGGSGGGGAGQNTGGGAGGAGTANTGGGGGGTSTPAALGGAGGSGVVILLIG